MDQKPTGGATFNSVATYLQNEVVPKANRRVTDSPYSVIKNNLRALGSELIDDFVDIDEEDLSSVFEEIDWIPPEV